MEVVIFKGDANYRRMLGDRKWLDNIFSKTTSKNNVMYPKTLVFMSNLLKIE